MAAKLHSNKHPFFHMDQSRLELGLNLVYDYIRDTGRRYLKAKYIAAYFGLQDDHETLTIIGWALAYLERRGVAWKYAKRTWVISPTLYQHLMRRGYKKYSSLRDIPLDKLTDDEADYVAETVLNARPIG